MTSVSYGRSRLARLTASEVEALAAELPFGGVPGSSVRRANVECAPPRRSRRTAAHRAAERGPVVSRRMRRVRNEELLELAAEQVGGEDGGMMTRGQVKQLYQREWRSAWTVLSEGEDGGKLWRRYVEMGEAGDGDGEAGKVESGGAGNGEGLGRVDRRFRELVKNRKGVVMGIVGRVEREVVGMPEGGVLFVGLNDALGRLVAHGVAQFHRLGHWSVGQGEKRVAVIQKRVGWADLRPLRLVDVLA